MALRILAGIVNIRRTGPKAGSVTIGFNPHARTAGDVDVVERRTVGADGDFTSTPAKHVALRQIFFSDALRPGDHRFTVNDHINENSLTITWSGLNVSFTEEISYMVIGDVAVRKKAVRKKAVRKKRLKRKVVRKEPTRK